MHFHIITIFPDMFDSYIHESMLKRAQEKGLIAIHFYDPRDYANDKHKTVDDTSYGGGPGMVIKAEPILKAVEAVLSKIKSKKSPGPTQAAGQAEIKIIILSPRGEQFTNDVAEEYVSGYTDIIIVAGRYEGIDARVKQALSDYALRTINCELIDISIGPYVLTGGEVPAMVVLEAVSRQIPGVLGTKESLEELRIASSEVYTRPDVLEWDGKKYTVPDILLSGDHKKIEAWRQKRQKN